jgi:DNA-binding MarR family transcriptional regulator
LDLAHELQRAVFRLNRDLRIATMQAGVSAADATLLAMLRRAPGIGVSQLAAAEQVGRSVMSERVSRLEASGLVERTPPQPGADQRRVGLRVTPAGLKVFAVIADRRRVWIEQRLNGLSPDDRLKLEAAVSVLDRLAASPAAGGAARNNDKKDLRETADGQG